MDSMKPLYFPIQFILQIGTVSSHIYSTYAHEMTLIVTFIIFISLLAMQSTKNVTDWWLSYWIRHETSNNGSAILMVMQQRENYFLDSPFSTTFEETKEHVTKYYYLYIYTALAIGEICD